MRETTNTNVRGSSADRAARRAYLVSAYRANVDIAVVRYLPMWSRQIVAEVPLGSGTPVCRCYRCGVLLSEEIVTVDRIVPGCRGGTYRRENIRPACGPCNSETGGATRRLR